MQNNLGASKTCRKSEFTLNPVSDCFALAESHAGHVGTMQCAIMLLKREAEQSWHLSVTSPVSGGKGAGREGGLEAMLHGLRGLAAAGRQGASRTNPPNAEVPQGPEEGKELASTPQPWESLLIQSPRLRAAAPIPGLPSDITANVIGLVFPHWADPVSSRISK